MDYEELQRVHAHQDVWYLHSHVIPCFSGVLRRELQIMSLNDMDWLADRIRMCLPKKCRSDDP